MSLKETISTQLRRRTHLVDKVINNLLPNMYPCDYNSSDHFVEGVLDEIRWFLVDMEELQGIERMDIENYILDNKYDELTEYFNERCIVLKNDNLQETIKKVLREETEVPSFVRRRVTSIDWQIKFAITEVNRQYNVCGLREEDYVETVIEKAITSMYWDFFSDMDDNSKEWEKSYNFMIRYADEKFTEMLKTLYQSICK